MNGHSVLLDLTEDRDEEIATAADALSAAMADVRTALAQLESHCNARRDDLGYSDWAGFPNSHYNQTVTQQFIWERRND